MDWGQHPAGGAAGRAGIADGFVAGPSTDLESTIELVETYRQAADRAGREPMVALMRDAWVGPPPGPRPRRCTARR